MFFIIWRPKIDSIFAVTISTPPLFLSLFQYRRGGIVPTHKSKIENEKARRVFVPNHYLLPLSKNDRDNYNIFFVISFRIVGIMELS